ncbi:hypothetical protein ACEQ8H_001520 [Pleosporales sp. CAS-2024a]
MSTARVSARALRALTSTSTTTTTTRSLSITGPATFSSLLTSDKPTSGRSNAPRLPVSATIPVPDTNDTGKPVRHFNTSRSLKAVNDSSTIDFMYIPEFDAELKPRYSGFRVPIMLGQQSSSTSRNRSTAEAESENRVFIPQISTVAADGTHIHTPSAMHEMTNSDHIDFQGLATSVAKQVKQRLRKPVEGEGMTRQILSDMWEDIVGAGKPTTVKA